MLKLFTRKECWVPTGRCWVVFVGVFLGALCLAAAFLNDFLSVNQPVPAQILVVEGWLPDAALRGALAEFRRGAYEELVTAGQALPEGWDWQHRFKTEEDLTAATLAALGLDTNRIAALHAGSVARDRTYSEALAVRAWLKSYRPSVRAVNLFSIGPHARRSRLLYEKALGSGVAVGVLAHPDPLFNPKRWWASSNGFRKVISEAIAYIYARFLFHPARVDT